MGVAREVELPVGVVTLLFTDIEGSTRLLNDLGDVYGEVLDEHHRLLRSAWEAHRGVEVGTDGDAFFVAFADACSGVEAASVAQQLLSRHRWPGGASVKVRMGVHTGRPRRRDRDYWGIDVHYAARLAAAASGGQVLVSESTAAGVEAQLEDLGEHALKDFPTPRRVFHLVVDGRGSGEFPAPRTLRARSTNLPAQLSGFVGRERELDQICALFDEAQVVTLVGVGGVGKSRVALAAGTRLLDRSGDGVWLVELAELSDPGLIASEIARALQVGRQPGRSMLDSLVEALREQNVTLVIDNCEHLVEAVAAIVVGIVRECPAVSVLASSREPLGVVGERVYRVPSLSLPETGDEDPFGSEAVRLFVQRVRDQRSSFEPDGSSLAAVVSIVRRLEGIPLALELAAARLRSLSVVDLAARLEQDLRLLTGGPRTLPARQQTLTALIEWSYRLLSEPERVLLARLSVFVGGFELGTAEEVCSGNGIDELEVIDLLGSLVDKSLVQVDDIGERVRYRLLAPVREYAAGRLAAGGEREQARVRLAHRDHFLALAERAEPLLAGPQQLAWLDRLELEHNNLRAALTVCLEDPDAEPGLRLALALNRFRRTRDHGVESARALGAQLRRPEASEATVLRARALIAAGGCLSNDVGDPGAGQELCEEALSTARAHNDARTTAEALTMLAWARFRQGRFGDALSCSDDAVALARDVGDADLLADALSSHSSALRNTGRDSSEVLEEAVRLHRHSGDHISLCFDLQQLGLLALGNGEIAVARGYFEEAVRLGRELKMTKFTWSTSINLGFAAYLADDTPAAKACFIDVVAPVRKHWTLALPHALFGVALTTSNDPFQAAMLHGATEKLLERSGSSLEALEIRLRDADYDRLNSALGAAGFRDAIEAGSAQDIDELISRVLDA